MLDIRGLEKTYANGVRALRDINLRMDNGIFGLLGPNGAGKSSLMRTLATLQVPDKGSVVLDGVDLLADPASARRRIGYLPQDFGLYPNVSAEALLDQFAVFKGYGSAGERRELVAHYLQLVNLTEHRKHALGGFSGGMRQRFGIAQALIGNPRLLIVDEPTAGLDPAERVRLQALLSELGEDRIVLLSTHIVEDVLALCRDIAVMNRGEVVCTGGLDELTRQLAGKVWTRDIDSMGDVRPEWRVISTGVLRGRRQVRVLADTPPEGGFSAVEAGLADVYFTALSAGEHERLAA